VPETTEDIINIHHLPAFDYEKLDFQNGIKADIPRMLAMIALETKKHSHQRQPLNSHITLIGHEGGDRAAKYLIRHASEMPVYPDAIEDGIFHEDGLWIGAKRLNAMQLAGSVLVQKGVSLIDENEKTIIKNGIIVEAVTATQQAHELSRFYEAGIAVANSMAENGEVVFSVETAETFVERQTRIEKWINGKLTFDEEVHKSVFSNYAHRSDPVVLRRDDFGNSKSVPAIIYTDSKSTIDLTTSK
jgi:hypothetical protein